MKSLLALTTGEARRSVLYMQEIRQEYGFRRVYDATPTSDGAMALRLKDRVVDLGRLEWTAYQQLANWFPTVHSIAELEQESGLSQERLARLCHGLCQAGLLYRR